MCASTDISTSQALKLLGNDYQAETRLYMDGFVDSSGILSRRFMG